MGISKFPLANNGTKMKTGNFVSQSSSLSSVFMKDSNVKNLKIKSSILEKGIPPTVKKALENLAAANTDVSAYEALTNLSSQRPEIIALLPFQPLYGDFGHTTPSGKLFDALVEYMRSVDLAKQKSVESLNKFIGKRNEKLRIEVTRIRDTLRLFYDVYRSLAEVRRSLTITNEYYDFNPTRLVNKMIRDDGDVDKTALLNYASKLAEEMNVKYTLGMLRYKDNFIDEFSPTSAFANLITETQRVLRTHSYRLSKNIKNSPPQVSGNSKYTISAPDRLFYSHDPNERVSLESWIVTAITSANFLNISVAQTALTEAQQLAVDANRQTAAEFKKTIGDDAGSLEAAELAESTADSLESDFKTTNNYNNLLELSNIIRKEFLDNDKKTLNKLTVQGSMAVVFMMISREIKMSKKWSPEMMGSFSADATIPSGIVRSIFGGLNDTLDLYQPVVTVRNSIMELAQLPVGTKQKVLLFEQSPGQYWGKDVLAGGDYYFDPELLITFANVGKLAGVKTTKNPDGTFAVTSGGPDVALRSRIESMAGKLNTTTTDFIKLATEMGLLVTKDEKIFDGEKPIFASSNPEAYFEKISNVIKASVKDDSKKSGFKNTSLAAKAIFSFIGSGSEKATELMSRIFIMVMNDVYEYETENTTNVSKLLIRGFNGLFEGNVNNSLKKNLIDIAKGIIKALADAEPDLDDDVEYFYNQSSSVIGIAADVRRGIGTDDPINKDEFGDRILRMYANRGVIPCIFDSAGTLLNAIREDKLFKQIVSILKDLNKTLETYAVRTNDLGSNVTKYNGVSSTATMSLMFWAICKMIRKASPYELVWSSRDTFLGLPESSFDIDIVGQQGEGGDDGIIFGYLKDLGLIGSGKDGTSELTVFVKKKNKSESPYEIAEVKAAIAEEMQVETASLLTVMNTLAVLNKNIQSVQEFFSKLETADYVNLINYLGDPNKLTFLLKEQQLTLAMSNIEDIYQSFGDFSNDIDTSPNDSKMFFTTYYDRLAHSEKMVSTLKKFFKSREFTSSKGYNKKIMSIGLSQDLLKNTLPKYDFQKQNDIFKLSIYKIDNLNSDIIYKPKSWLFEASRYPSRVYSDYKYDLSSLQSIPTRNYSITYNARSIDQGESAYWSDISNSFGEEYSFLSREEKEEIIENQAMSILMENYIRIVTGLVINESAFSLMPDEVEALLRETEFQTNAEQLNPGFTLSENKEAAEKVNNILSNKNLWSKPKPKSSGGTSGKSGKPKLSGSTIKALSSGLVTGVLKNIITKVIAIDPDVLLRYVIQPKKFDRIFNIIFDPEFIVDAEKTNSTAVGRNALKRMVDEGKIIKKFEKPTDITASLEPMYVDRDKESQDTTVESFFVVLESHGIEKKTKYDVGMLKKFPASMLPKVVGSISVPQGVGLKNPLVTNFAMPKNIMSLDIGNLRKKFNF